MEFNDCIIEMKRRFDLHFKVLMNRIIWKVKKKPIVKSIDETLDYILEHHCSVSRYGDGEFTIMLGVGCDGYQDANSKIAERSKEVLIRPIPDHIVCLHDVFGDLSFLKKSSIDFNRGMIVGAGAQWLELIPSDRVYYNTFFTRCYNMFEDKSNAYRWFEKNKMIWRGRDILLIEGEKSRLGVGNDLFAEAKSVRRILGPAQNAFEKYDELFRAAKQYGGKGKLVLIALGMTATVLAYDLAKEGIWAIDIGHIDIEYEWYLRNATEKVAIEGKFVNEAPGGRVVTDQCNPLYESQIITKIL